ncbi:hypothetical protein FE257_005928 [Aspergillus nanangensis]|uniref:ER-bound oxygenase mpaB/mpaB'/Rubber oxygenase catalytic domain-containing protein n=1 Tax=Aspergillus nanangensis TaxID=2582783 RepID=A0AAD4CRL6_ASPNN|nr:hypothetical protein FE257_005928 [Aspergillus nanangensis]
MSKTTTGNRTEYHYWDYSFVWTDEHPPRNKYESWIHSCDSLADECNELLNAFPIPASEKGMNAMRRDRYALLRDNYESAPKLKELWAEINTVPDWVDWDQIKRGQDVYWRYLLPFTTSLTFQSLLGGMGAIRVGETLARTGGFDAKVVRRRLLETAQHTAQVNSSPEGMKPGGEGHLACVRVRMLHSAVRLKILSLVEQDPNYYDVSKYGLPVNDLDSFGTIHTFCSTPIWLGLPRQGIYLSEQEITDYIALWRLVAFYMGAPTEPFESAAKAKASSEILLINEFAPTDTGRALAKNILIGLENTAPAYASKGYMSALTRLVNGKQLSDELHIPQTNWYYWVLVWGYCFWVQLHAKTIAQIPFIDRRIIVSQRQMFWKTLMDEKTGIGKETIFDFKYIPSLKRMTRPGEWKNYSFKRPGVEILSYLGLLSAFAVVVGVSASLYIVITGAFPESRALVPMLTQPVYQWMAGLGVGSPTSAMPLLGLLQGVRDRVSV